MSWHHYGIRADPNRVADGRTAGHACPDHNGKRVGREGNSILLWDDPHPICTYNPTETSGRVH
ncbi:MAG: hypothetical protein OJF47_003798 [Nitrospira sp.]|nr:MAG: hypothetical protein OJF47_003798 [Nitrospira sp.]